MNKKSVNKTSKRYKPKRLVNVYSDAGPLETDASAQSSVKDAFNKKNLANTLGAIGAGVSGIASASIANAKVDTSSADNAIEAVESFQPSYDSLDSLANSYNNLNLADTSFNNSDFTVSTKEGLGNMGKAALSGASAGAAFGPWGAVIGGAAGLLGSGVSWIAGSSKAKKEAERLAQEAKIANISAMEKFNVAKDEIQENEYMSYMRNIAARGGRIYTRPENVGNLFNIGGLMFQHGGIFSNGITTIGNGGTHEENPFEGVQIGVDNQGIPNLVEEGEVIWNDYVFSNRLKPNNEFRKKYKFKGETFADISKEIQKESEERPNDPISKTGLEDSMTKLMMEQESVRQLKGSVNNTFKCGGMKNRKYDKGSWLRYAPVVGSGLSVLSDAFGITNKPDYSNVDLIKTAANNIRDIGYTPITERLQYTPFDTQFYSTKLAGQTAATKKAIQNNATTSGAAISGLLAADYNAQTKLGELYRGAEEYNQAQKERVAGFNRQTSAINSEMAMKAALANQESDVTRLKAAMTEAQMRDQLEASASAARSANLSTLFTNLGNVGTDILNRADRDMLIKSGVFGTLSQKPSWWTDDEWNDYVKSVNDKKIVSTPTTAPVIAPSAPTTPVYTIGHQKAMPYSEELFGCGGRVRKRKNRKGLTY